MLLILMISNQYPVSDNDDSVKESEHRHVTLKAVCPTKWNSSLKMIESIINVQRKVMNMLKRIGKAELRLGGEEMEMQQQLRAFLKPFETFTDLVFLLVLKYQIYH